MNNHLKTIIAIGAIIIFVLLLNYYNTSKDNDNEYIVILDDNKINVCGEEIYITNYTYNDEILIDDLIRELEYICQEK